MRSVVAKRFIGIALASLPLLHGTTSVAGVSSRLVYTRGEGADTCPDATGLRSAVAERLGYDPFVAYADTTVVAEVVREAGKWKARARLVDAAGVSRGSRELMSDGDDCSRLLGALALAISIALDPMTAVVPVTPPPRTPKDDAPAPDTSATEPESPPQRERIPMQPDVASAAPATPRPWGMEFGARTFVSAGWLPAVSGGIAGFGRLGASKYASISLEGQAELPVGRDAVMSGRVTAWTWAASVLPCAHLRPAAVCAMGTLGQLMARGDGVSRPEQAAAWYPALGGRALLDWKLDERFLLEFHGDVSAPLVRTTLALNGAAVWRAPGAALTAGAGLVARVW